MTTPVVDHTLVFALVPSMTFEDSIKEMYTRVANSTHLYKMTMQAMVVHLMAWEGVSATGRAIAAAAGAVYVPYTLAEYDVMIDRAANVAYIAGGAPPALNPFVENMADAADELTSAFEVFTSKNNWNIVYTAGGAAAVAAAHLAQQGKVDRGISAMLKDCNFQLMTALCNSFNTPGMQPFQHLTNLDFVANANSPQTNFGRIPLADTRYPHVQLFCRLAVAYFQAVRLRSSSTDTHFALYNAPNLSAGLEVHKRLVDPWFVNIRRLNFATTAAAFDYLQAGTRVAFVYKLSQDPLAPEPLRREALVCYQAYCNDSQTNAAPMTLARWESLEARFRTAISAAGILPTFDAKPFEKVFDKAPVTNLVSDTSAILALGKAIEALNLRQLSAGTNNDSRTRLPYNPPSCFWCGKKGHNLIDCTGPPPNAAAKQARDDVLASRANRQQRNGDRQARRLSSAATHATVSDDEIEDYESIHTKIQALFEPTKS